MARKMYQTDRFTHREKSRVCFMNTKSSVDKITSIIIIVLFMKVDKSKTLR